LFKVIWLIKVQFLFIKYPNNNPEIYPVDEHNI